MDAEIPRCVHCTRLPEEAGKEAAWSLKSEKKHLYHWRTFAPYILDRFITSFFFITSLSFLPKLRIQKPCQPEMKTQKMHVT